ncbi:MAG: NADH:ubiquinone reductase (Na(+)-transporting) subunit C [bacterium]
MSTPKGDGYVIGFALVVCVVCSLMLSATASILKERQDYNVELDRKFNVLKAFGAQVRSDDGRRISGPEIDRIFREKISEIVLDGASGQLLDGKTSADFSAEDLHDRKVLPLYVWKENGELDKVALPIHGKGLWSTIYGYISLKRDLATIEGITFYKHGETPGLGGEVETDWFQDQFKGKMIFEDGQRLHFDIVKGKVADRYPEGNNHAVDGISGATLTGKGVMTFLNSDLDKYENYFKLLRKS